MKIKFDKNNPRLLGDVLKELRKEHGFSQTTVAKHLGVDRTTYTKYELGRTPDISIIAKISALYGISADSLISIFSFDGDDSFSRCAELGSSDEESFICLLSKEEQLIIDYYRKSLRKSDIIDTVQNYYFNDNLDCEAESDND